MNKFCIIALFSQNEADIKRLCEQSVMLNQKLPLAMYLSNGIWTIITNEHLQFTITCKTISNHLTVVDINAPYGILYVNKSCFATKSYMHLPCHFDKHSYFETSVILQGVPKNVAATKKCITVYMGWCVCVCVSP